MVPNGEHGRSEQLLSRPAGASKMGIGTYQRIKFVQQLASRKVATGFWFAWLRNSMKQSTMHPDRVQNDAPKWAPKRRAVHPNALQNGAPCTKKWNPKRGTMHRNGIQNKAPHTKMGFKTEWQFVPKPTPTPPVEFPKDSSSSSPRASFRDIHLHMFANLLLL